MKEQQHDSIIDTNIDTIIDIVIDSERAAHSDILELVARRSVAPNLSSEVRLGLCRRALDVYAERVQNAAHRVDSCTVTRHLEGLAMLVQPADRILGVHVVRHDVKTCLM